MFNVGDSVTITRPHLWSKCSGTVVKADPKTGIHRIHITARDGVAYPGGFHADAPGTQLEPLDLLA